MVDDNKPPVETTKKQDIYAEQTPSGTPAYPQVIYQDTGEKYPNGEPIMKVLGTAKNPDEHKKLLEGAKAWKK